MLTDPWFYAVAIAAVMIFGIGKGGFGGGLGLISVPLMAIMMPPAQAVAIMLPVISLMDLQGIRAFRKSWDRRATMIMLPAALAGIALGGIAIGTLDPDIVRLVLGFICIAFTAYNFLAKPPAETPGYRPILGAICGATAGFTSTIAHSGGPPANFYLLAIRLDKSAFVGTMIIVFTVINAFKYIPYAALGLFTQQNLLASLFLAPAAYLGMWLGIKTNRYIDQAFFFKVIYVLILLTGLKLVYDGVT